MKLISLQLKNFKLYVDQYFNFTNTQNKNISLIGGKNGVGKTTFLESLYLCLYGKDGFDHYRRNTNQHLNYTNYIESSLNRSTEASPRGISVISLNLSFLTDTNITVSIERKYSLIKSKFNQADEEVKIDITFQNGDVEQINGISDCKEWIDQNIMSCSQVFIYFFDGEKIGEQFQNDSHNFVTQQLLFFLGVNDLKALHGRLSEIYEDFSKEVKRSSADSEQFDFINNQLISVSRRLKIVEDDINTHTDKINKEKMFDNKTFEQIQRNYTMSAENNDDHIKKLSSIKIELNSIQLQLQTLFSNSSIISQFLSHNELAELSSIIRSEEEYIRWSNNKSSFDPKKKKFADNIKQYLINHEIKFSIEIIENAIDEAWVELFMPQPKLEKNDLIFGFLDDPTRAQILLHIEDIFSNVMTIPDIEKYELLQDEQLLINKELEDLRNKTSDPHFNNLMMTHKESQEKVLAWTTELEDFKHQKLSLTAEKTELNKQLSSLGHIADTDGVLYSRQITAKVKLFIDDFIEKLYKLKLKSISDDMTTIFAAMNNKSGRNLIFKVTEDGDIKAINHEFDDYVDYKKYNLSAGETQQMVLSFILALSKSAKLNFPIIIDTPLGRLDKDNRVGILDYFVNYVNDQQILLLSTDTEVVDDLFDVIKNNTSDLYLLRFDGIKTYASRNEYFGNMIQ